MVDSASPPTPPAGLQAAGWGWRHAGRGSWALRGLDLSIAPGERVLLLGASGAGKSTLAQALAGVLGGSDEGEEEGSLTVDGEHPTAVRGRVGLLMQDPDSQLVLARVGDDVAFGCENLAVPRDEIWPRVTASLEAVGLDLALDHSTSELSGGQKQRVALAGVLAMRPSVVLLDEPTANLDPEGVVDVRDAVADVVRSSNATFIVIEHRVDIWLDVVDRVVVLAPGGGVLADGDPRTVLRERGAELAAGGVWVPGHDPLAGRPPRTSARIADAATPATPPAASPTPPATPPSATPLSRTAPLLTATDLAIARVPGTPVADAIHLALLPGTATAITGPNGAGKTTLALTLAGLLPAVGGELRAGAELVEGTGIRRAARRAVRATPALTASPGSWRSRDLLTRLGMVFQDPEHQFVSGTVRGELEVALRALGLPADEIASRIDETAGRLRLENLLTANPYTLSGGEKRRLSVASALVARPRILVLDEPTFGQDSRTWAELVLLLAELLDQGTAVVAVTHDRAFIDALADREYVVDGRVRGVVA